MRVLYPNQIGSWNVGFQDGGKPKDPEKNSRSKDKNQPESKPATLVGGAYHCAIPVSLIMPKLNVDGVWRSVCWTVIIFKLPILKSKRIIAVHKCAHFFLKCLKQRTSGLLCQARDKRNWYLQEASLGIILFILNNVSLNETTLSTANNDPTIVHSSLTAAYYSFEGVKKPNL